MTDVDFIDHLNCNSPTDSTETISAQSTAENHGDLRAYVGVQNSEKYLENLDGTHCTSSIAYDVCLSSNSLPSGPIAIAFPARLRARLKPIHLNDQPDTILHKIADRQQRAAIRREIMLQGKKRRARVAEAKLYERADLIREKLLREKQKKASLRRDEKVEEKVTKAIIAERSPWFAPDRVPSKATVEDIKEKQRQADERRQLLEDLKLKKAHESQRSHWYSPDKLKPKVTAEQLLEKQARADRRRRQCVETRLQRMQQCEEKTKKLVKMMKPVVISANKERPL